MEEQNNRGTPARDPGPPKVREVLGLDALQRAEIVAGADGLDREVTGANIVEVPDVYRWLTGGEFLFTAGYAWRGDPDRLVDILEQLDDIGISALGVKPGAYLKDIPQALIEKADELQLPVIKIPPNVAYRDVIEPLYRRLTERRLWVLERSTRAQEMFAPLGLDDQSIEKVAAALAEEVNNPVYVMDMVGDSVVVARPGEPATKRPSLDLEGEDASVAKSIIDLTLKRTTARIDLPEGPALGASLIVGRRSLGRIAVLQQGSELDEFVELAVSHGAELISFLLMRQMAIIEGRREAGDLFFDSLITDTLSNEEAAERALTLGLRLTRPCMALVIGSSSEREDEAELLRIAGERAMSSYPHVIGKGEEGSDVVILFEAPASLERDGLEQLASRITELAVRGEIKGILIGAGSARVGLAGVRRSRSEAMVAYQVGRRMGIHGLSCFEDLKVERLLAQIPHNSLSTDYIKMTIGPLESEPEMIRTLEAFLEHGGNKVATAAAIPLHRSSLAYRLEKIQKLLDIDLDDPEHQLELWLALRLRRIFSLSEADEA